MGMLRHGTCLATRRRLDDLCDHELEPSIEQRVRRHLAGCERCRDALGRLRATIADLGTLGAHTPPRATSVRERIVDELGLDAGGGTGHRDGGGRR